MPMGATCGISIRSQCYRRNKNHTGNSRYACRPLVKSVDISQTCVLLVALTCNNESYSHYVSINLSNYPSVQQIPPSEVTAYHNRGTESSGSLEILAYQVNTYPLYKSGTAIAFTSATNTDHLNATHSHLVVVRIIDRCSSEAAQQMHE